MNVSLTPELERFVNDLMESGRYQSVNDIVSAGLEMLVVRQAAIDEINEMIDESEADIAAGRTYSPEEAREILRAHRQSLSVAKTA